MSGSASVVFFGTPAFAVPTLAALCKAPDFEPVLLVTRPDRVRGRGSRPTPSETKRFAEARGIAVAQPERASDPALLDQLQALSPDLIVVVAYGGKIPPPILELPRIAIVNLHGSLLPAYRGAAPIQYALLDGLDETGLTVQHLAEGWDEGDIILQQTEAILPDDTYDTLSLRLAEKGAALMLDALRRLVAGTAPRLPQDHARATFARLIKPEQCVLDWREPARRLHHRVRALASRPGARTGFRGKTLRILRTRPLDEPASHAPGTLEVGRKSVVVHTGEGRLELLEVQPEGRKTMPIADFINGQRPATGEVLAAPEAEA